MLSTKLNSAQGAADVLAKFDIPGLTAVEELDAANMNVGDIGEVSANLSVINSKFHDVCSHIQF